MIEHTYFRARITLGCSIVGYASAHNPGTRVTTETKGRHQHWTAAKASAEAYLDALGDEGEGYGYDYQLQRVTIDVENFEVPR